jgi:chromosome segregation ATPase
MTEDQIKVIFDRLESIQKSLDRIDRDMGDDRKNLQETPIRLGSVANQVEQMREAVHTLPGKLKDKMEDAVKPITEEAHSLKETIEKKRVIEIKARTTWQKFKHWLSKGWE